MAELHPGRAAVVALARARRDLHLAQQGVHLGDREDPPGADRAVAGDGRGDMVELVARGSARSPSSAISAARSASRPRDVGLAERRREWRGPASPRAEALELEAHVGEVGEPRLRAGRSRARRARPLRGSAAPGGRPPPFAAPRASVRAPAARARHAGRRSPARPRPRRRYRSRRPGRGRRRAGSCGTGSIAGFGAGGGRVVEQGVGSSATHRQLRRKRGSQRRCPSA